MKKFIKPLLYSFVFFIIAILFLTILNYIGIISGLPLKILKILIPLISFFINGFLIGKVSNEKGWLNGIKSGLLLLLIIVILSILFKTNFNFKTIISYVAYVLFSTFGSMIGISKNLNK